MIRNRRCIWLRNGVVTLIVIFGIVVVPATNARAASGNYTLVGRYLTVPNKPLKAQINLLQQTVQLHFPENVQTVGEAVEYILRFSGYSLADKHTMSSPERNMLELKLPLVDRNLGPISLLKALQTLAGRPYRLLIDQIHRFVSFQLKPSFISGGNR